MINLRRFLLVTAFAGIGSGCWSSAPPPGTGNQVNITRSSGQSSDPTSADVNKPGESNTPTVPTEGTIANRIAKRNERVNANLDAKPGKPEPLRFEPGPEDSEVAVAMQPDGSVLEVRVFRNHGQLARAEAHWFPGGPKKLKISLRNGRVATVETDRVANLKTAPANLLVELAAAK